MRVGYLDCIGGISGDMFLGALLDAGWPEARLRQVVAWLGGEVAELRVETRMRRGFRGLGIVLAPAVPPEHHHRGLPEVLALLAAAPLPAGVRQRAEQVFRRLAEAEGRAHGKPPDEIRFHEIGAIDAMIDIVGASLGLADLGIEQLYFSPLPMGAGQIPSAHGPIPLPAPATALLTRGTAVAFTGCEGEWTTPTGAALVTTLGRCAPPPPMTIEAIGTGAGSRSHADWPNLARLFVGVALPQEAPAGALPAPDASAGRGLHFFGDLPRWGWEAQVPGASPCGQAAGGDGACPGRWGQVALLETQIDDASPEEVALLAERLRAQDALEVFTEAIQMKKGRMGCRLTVVCRPAAEESLAALLLLQSTTLGVRRRLEWRRELERRLGQVVTSYGQVDYKAARRGPRWIAQPEYESCRRVAEAAGVPFRDVFRAALAALAGVEQSGSPGGGAGPGDPATSGQSGTWA